MEGGGLPGCGSPVTVVVGGDGGGVANVTYYISSLYNYFTSVYYLE